jgi:hypothetical protein
LICGRFIRHRLPDSHAPTEAKKHNMRDSRRNTKNG